MNRLWWGGWTLILLISLGLRIWPLLSNSFYFTVDQGRDAVYVREILQHGTIFTKGPEATIRGIFTGPGWYYWLAPGYFLAGGQPVGGIISLIIINLVVLGAVMRMKGLKVGLMLACFWPFYEASRYAFNPFLLVSLAIILGLALEQRKLWIGLLMVFLAYNTQLFGAAVFAGVWLVAMFVKKFNWYMYCGLLVAGCLAGYVLSPVWRDWYVIFLWPILLIALGQKLNKWLTLGVVVLELVVFVPRYLDTLHSTDTSILANELATVDWIYKDQGANGLYIYDYTDRFYDYPYQYLLWREGLKQLQGVPCEYANFPGSDKTWYVPGFARYDVPQIGCDKLTRYLILESQSNGEANSDWVTDFRTTTKLIETKKIGKTIIEKRQTTPLFADRYNTGQLYKEYQDNALIIKIPENWPLERPGREEFTFKNSDGSISGWAKSIGKNCPDYFSDDNSEFSQRTVGKVNDYLISLKMTGVMARAEKLREEILKGVKFVEDSGTKEQSRCGA